MKLEGKTAFITGGGTGIGKAAAIALAAEGARVMVMGRRAQPLEETVAQINDRGGIAVACPGDVSRLEDIQRAERMLRNEFGRLDILVNNAGVAMYKKFTDMSIEDFDRIYEIDLRSVFAVTKTMYTLMMENGGASIINISSILGVLGGKNASAYCAMKGGVVQLTRALAAELGPEIRVNCLCPSHIVTDMMQKEMDRLAAAGKMGLLTRRFPMQRVAYPEDMNGSIVFFASDDSAWLTGNILMIDGGLSCYI